MVGEGKFVLYSRIEPPLEAGSYRFRASQTLSATGHSPSQLPVDELPAHVTVRSPRFALPPDQVLSTFPPAGSEGAYGSRLPQVVIRRRTLPWERLLGADLRGTPWLALVLIAEGEAELKMNQPVAQCVTPGVTLSGPADTELGNYLQIRKSVVERVFPTRMDVPLLAHAREVDIHDTELMMGDDDGFLAVVISNRLPLPGRDTEGDAIPVKYLACLVNLEGQFMELLEKSPPPAPFTTLPTKAAEIQVNLAEWDHGKMGGIPYGIAPGGPQPKAAGASTVGMSVGVANSGASPYDTPATWTAGEGTKHAADVYAEMAQDFSQAVISGFIGGAILTIDPTLRFPVLLHWSFTSAGSVTFRSLMEGLDSGLLGTVGEDPTKPGRMPLEVVETGHTGLAHRTRRGDEVRSWYRGPFVPHPTADPPGGRLKLAHAADQLRIVVPDGREDISLAAAFEIGRLLALARPSMVAALLRWRQAGFQAARQEAVWQGFADFIGDVGATVAGKVALDHRLGVLLGRALAESIVRRPEDFVGDPRPPVDAGRPLEVDGSAVGLMAKGFGLPAKDFSGDPLTVLDRLRERPPRAPADLGDASVVRHVLTRTLDIEVDRLVIDALRLNPDQPQLPVPKRARRDALDELIDHLSEEEER